MTVTLSYYLEDVDAQRAAGWTHLRLYRDTVPDGSFATVVDTVALVAAQTDYEIADATGTSRSWYRAALHDSVTPATSTKGDPFRPDATRLLDVMQAGAELAGAGFQSSCTSAGTVSTLVDQALVDNGVASDYLESGWILLPDASAADQQRRVRKGGFDFTNGSLAPVRDWSVLPASGAEYRVFLLLPPFKMPGAPYSWADAARDGLQMCYFEDRVDIGTGTSTRVDEFDLGVHLGWLRENDVRKVWLERYNATTGAVISRVDASKGGRYYRKQPNGRGSLKLILRPAPSTIDHIIVEANRRDAELYAAEDVTDCPLRLAARACMVQAYEYLNRVHTGKYQGELESARRLFDEEYFGDMVTSSVTT